MRRPRPEPIRQQIDPLDPSFLCPGTLVVFKATFTVPSRTGEDGPPVRSVPLPGHAYVVRGQFIAGRVDLDERRACTSRPKVGMPRGRAVAVVMNVPVEWIAAKEAKNAQEIREVRAALQALIPQGGPLRAG